MRKCSEVLQLALDEGYYTGRGFMCYALAQMEWAGRINWSEMQQTQAAIRRAIRGRMTLASYLVVHLGLDRIAARKSANKLAFYRGLIKRLQARGV